MKYLQNTGFQQGLRIVIEEWRSRLGRSEFDSLREFVISVGGVALPLQNAHSA